MINFFFFFCWKNNNNLLTPKWGVKAVYLFFPPFFLPFFFGHSEGTSMVILFNGGHHLVFLSPLQLIRNKWVCIYITNFPPQWNNVNLSVQHKHSQFNSFYSTFTTIKWQNTQVIQWMYHKEMLYNLMHEMQFILSCHILHNPFIGLTVFCTFFFQSLFLLLKCVLCFSMLQPRLHIVALVRYNYLFTKREIWCSNMHSLFIYICWAIQL